MRGFSIYLFSCLLLYGEVYYAKNEPYKKYEISSEVSGSIVFLDKKLQGKADKEDRVIVKIDDKLDRELLKLNRESLQEVERKIEALKEIVEMDRLKFERVKDLKTKSETQKESELKGYLNTKIQLSGTLEQKISIQKEIAKLEEGIKNKNITSKGLYVGDIYVEEGSYITQGKRVVDLYDTSKAKLTFFISKEDMENLESSDIFIDEIKFNGKFDFIQKVADNENISFYKVQLLKESPKIFSTLSKIEIKSR